MRRAALAALLLLAACTPLSGASLESCGRDWFEAEPVIVDPAGAQRPEPVPIACARHIGEERLRLGFEMPPGPACHRLAGVQVDERADAVAVTVLVAEADDPAAGACAPRPTRVVTEIDLQAPIAERTIIDASQADE